MGLAEAQAKWERKTANAGAKYDAKVGQMTQNYTAGLAAFGTPPGPMTTQAYSAGIQGGGAKLQAGVQGKGPKWANNFRTGIAR
jgi:hypothetical protein